VAKQDEQGQWRFRYDPAVSKVFSGALGQDVDLRPIWGALRGPVMVIRGEHSDLLTPEVFEEMRARPRTETLLVPRTGHVPMLMDDSQVGPIRRFLLS